MTRKYSGRRAAAFLSILLALLIICSASDIQADFRSNEVQPAQAGSYDHPQEFMLPISMPENQVFSGVLLAKARYGPLQSRNRLLFVLVSRSLLLFGCMELWKHNAFKFIQDAFRNRPELSLRIGGHAPPEVKYVS